MSFNTRRSIEELLIPTAFTPVVSGAFEGSEREKLIRLLVESISEVTSKLNNKDRGYIIEKTRNTIKKVFLFPKGPEGLTVSVGGVYLYYFMSNMLEQQAYYIGSQSNYNKFWDSILPTLSDWFDNKEVREEAYDCARISLNRLQKELHMFEDVVWLIPKDYALN